MIKKRDEKRIPFRKLVICKCGDEMHPAFTQDVSQHGIGIQTIQRPSLFHKVRIALAVGRNRSFWTARSAGPMSIPEPLPPSPARSASSFKSRRPTTCAWWPIAATRVISDFPRIL